jgi:uridine phosphorylase
MSSSDKIAVINSLLAADHMGLLEARKKGLFTLDISKAIVHGNPDRVHEHAKLLRDYRLIALKRGFVSYLGYYKGEPLIITSSGMGAGSAAIVFEELIEHGISKIIRVGTCGSYREYIRPGDIVIPTEVLLDGPSLRYIFPDYLRDRELNIKINWLYVKDGFYFVKGFENVFEVLKKSVEKTLKEMGGLSINYHLSPIHDKDVLHAWRERYSMNTEALAQIKNKIKNLTIATDMESGVLFTIAHMRDIMAGSILVTVDFFADEEVKQKQMKGIEIAYRASLEAISMI